MSHHIEMPAPHVHPVIAWTLFLISLSLHALPMSTIDMVGHLIIYSIQFCTGILAGLASWAAYKHYRREEENYNKQKQKP